MRQSMSSISSLSLTAWTAALLLAAAVSAHAAGSEPVKDSRYPVTLTPAEALAQKAQMQHSLESLRHILVSLAAKDYAAVEAGVPGLGHATSVQQAATTTVYKKMDADFQAATAKVTVAARAKDMDAVLRELGQSMSWCQACHAALRQEVVPGEPEQAAPGK